MKIFSRFVSTLVLPLFLLMASAAALAIDTDGDGIPDPLTLQISAGYQHTCALDSTSVYCWGGAAAQAAVPALNHPTAVSAGGSTCALDSTGVHCWGNNISGQTTVPTLTNPTAVSAGYQHTCALDSIGVHCWGDYNGGKTTVPPLVNPVAVFAGQFNSCAIDDNGLKCWGYNYYGTNTVPPLVNLKMVSVGGEHICALDDNGVHCWGYNASGQTTVPALTNPTAVSAGGYNTCALDSTGVHCWGYTGNGVTAVPALTDPTAVSVGNNHACALDSTGVHCWGYNSSGQTYVPLPPGDNCPNVANADQLDMDGDGIGDACDPDIDGDGVLNAADAYPLDRTESADSDGDGIADNVDSQPNNANVLGDYRGESIGSKTGSSVAFAGDFNGDGFGDYVVGIPRYVVAVPNSRKRLNNAGRAVVISGKDRSVLASINGIAANDAMGFAVAGGSDIDNDGFDDVVIGAPFADDTFNEIKGSGSVTILFGNSTHSSSAFPLYGVQAKSLFGSAVALGDVNNDSYADIIVGVPKADDLRDPAHQLIDVGSVTVYAGDICVYSVLHTFYGATAKAYAGTSVAVGDVDGDGVADIVYGSPGAVGNVYEVLNMPRDETMAASVFANSMDTMYNPDYSIANAGSVTATNLNHDFIFEIYGADVNAKAGTSVAVADINNDGRSDIVVGVPGDYKNKKTEKLGSVSVFTLLDVHAIPLAGFYTDGLLFKRFGSNAKSGFGEVVAAGDVNGDGFVDIVVGASKDDKSGKKVIRDIGSVSVWSGSDYSLITTKYGDASKDYYGTSVSAGDINGDGKADLIIGIPGFPGSPGYPQFPSFKNIGAVQVLNGAAL